MNHLKYLIISVILAIGLAVLGAYFGVVSQNSSTVVHGAATNYGPVE